MTVRRKTIFTLLIVSAVLAGVSPAQQREAEPVSFNRFSDRVYEIAGGSGARGGLYIGDDGVLVVDAKMDEKSMAQVFEGIKKITDKPIRFLVNTHSDGDHVRGNRYFPPSVTIVAHENCRKEFFLAGRDGNDSEWSDPSLAPFVPSVTFNDRMDIYLGTHKVELRHFGVGHTIGDVVVYIPGDKVAFIGDQYFTGRPQLIHAYKGGNTFGHVRNLSKMLDTLDAGTFFSGHSEPVGREAVKEHMNAMIERQKKVKAAIDAGKSLEEIQRGFDENEKTLVGVIYNEITTR